MGKHSEVHGNEGLELLKPAREQASTRRKPEVSMINAPGISHIVTRDQLSPQKTSRFVPLILVRKGSALPWPVDDRASLRPLPNKFLTRLTHPIEHATVRLHVLQRPSTLSATVLPASRVQTISRRAPNWSWEEAHRVTTKPPPRLNRPAESFRQPGGAIS